jgi:UDP-glucose 4-epimerase
MSSSQKNMINHDRVVVLGGSGFIGSAIIDLCNKRQMKCVSITRKEINLLDDSASKKLSEILKPSDCVVVACAVAPVKNIQMLIDNLKIAEEISKALMASPVNYLLNVSSDAVYQDSNEPLTENSFRAPSSLHGIMHLSREIRFEMLSVPTGIICPTLVYGIKDPHNGYGPNLFSRQAQKGDDIKLFGKGEELRDHIFVDDVAILCLKMIESKVLGRVNAVTGKVISFDSIATSCSKLVNNRVSVHHTKRNGSMPHNGYREFNTSKLNSLFPDFKATSLSIGLAKLFK